MIKSGRNLSATLCSSSSSCANQTISHSASAQNPNERVTAEESLSGVHPARVIPTSRNYSLLRRCPERCFEHAARAKSFRCVGKDFGAALSADSDYCDHDRRIARALPQLVLRKIFPHVILLLPKLNGATHLRDRQA